MNETLSQGKAITATENGWKITPNAPFYWAGSFLRSILTNSIISVAKHGPSAIFNLASLQASATNSLINVFSRSEIDRWLAQRIPSTRDSDGKIVVLPGQWSQKRASNINMIWNASQGFIKNLNYVANDPLFNTAPTFRLTMNLLFGGMAALNVGLMLKPLALTAIKKIATTWTRWFEKTTRDTITDCRTLLKLSRPSPIDGLSNE